MGGKKGWDQCKNAEEAQTRSGVKVLQGSMAPCINKIKLPYSQCGTCTHNICQIHCMKERRDKKDRKQADGALRQSFSPGLSK